MLRIQRSANREVVFTMIGQMDEESILDFAAHQARDGMFVANSITLKNRPAYVREWITAKRRES
jgi:hypothetical protein